MEEPGLLASAFEAKALMGVFTPEVEGEWVDSDDPAMRSFFAKLPAPSASIANGSNVRASIGAANAVAELSFVAFVPSAGEPSESSLALTLSLASPAAGSQRRSSAKKARTSLSASKASSAKKSSAKPKTTPKAADDDEAAATAESLALDPDAFLESPYVELSEELQAMLEGTPADALVQSRVDRREPKEDGDEYFGSARKPMPAPDFEATAAAAPTEEAAEAATEAAPALDEATIKAMKVAELKDALSARGLDTDGKKAQLAARLLKAVAAAAVPVETPAAEEAAPAIVLPPSVVEEATPAVEEAAPALDVDSLKVADLKKELEARGIAPAKLKAQMQVQLKAAIEAAPAAEAEVAAPAPEPMEEEVKKSPLPAAARPKRGGKRGAAAEDEKAAEPVAPASKRTRKTRSAA